VTLSAVAAGLAQEARAFGGTTIAKHYVEFGVELTPSIVVLEAVTSLSKAGKAIEKGVPVEVEVCLELDHGHVV
jgi:hypothetical protein